MRVEVVGVNLPGSVFCRPDGTLMTNVQVGVQVRRDPAWLVRADEAEARWVVDIEVVRSGDSLDFRGAAVHGKPGERFIYLTWGNVGPDSSFEMFRRAKLMLSRISPDVLERAALTGALQAVVDLTDPRGGPRCARVDPPDLTWSAPPG